MTVTAQTPPTAPPQDPHRKWWVLLAVGLSTLLAALNSSLVNTILPLIGRDFHQPVATTEWVTMIFLLGISGFLLSFGRLGDLRGHKPIFMAGFWLFTFGTGLCGFAHRIDVLIGYRALQALGAAMMYANAPALLLESFSPAERGQALGLQGTLTYIGLMLGPTAGGWCASVLGWRWVFLLNVPVCVLGLAIGQRLIPDDRPAREPAPFDFPGAATFTISLTALMVALSQGAHWGWESAPTLALFGFAAVFAAAFFVIERRRPHPMLDLALFDHPIFAGATLAALLNYICVYTIMFLVPFYLIQGRGMDAATAGFVITAQPLVMAIAAPTSGTLSDRVGTRWPAALGMVGLYLLSRLGPAASMTQVAIALAVAGLGTGVFVSPNNSALMGAAPRHRQGIAGGVLATARNLGMLLGVAFAGAIYGTVLVHHPHPNSADGIAAAVDTSFLAAVAVALLGAIVSLVRPRAVEP